MSSDVFRCSPWVAYEAHPGGEGEGDSRDEAGNATNEPRPFTKFRVKIPKGALDPAQDAANSPDSELRDAPHVKDEDAGSTSGLAVAPVPSELEQRQAQQQAMMATFEFGPGQEWTTAPVKPPRKKPTKRGGITGSAGSASTRGGVRKSTTKNTPRTGIDVDDVADDVSYASSPAQVPRDMSVDPDPEPSTSQIPDTDAPAESIPVPSYALPTHSFAVAPPIKPSNTTPKDVQADRSTTPVRRWRMARREIRGIAGGRWFVRAWVGEKDSAWASSNAAATAAAQLLSMAAGTSSVVHTSSKPPKHARRLASGTASTPTVVPNSSPPPTKTEE